MTYISLHSYTVLQNTYVYIFFFSMQCIIHNDNNEMFSYLTKHLRFNEQVHNMPK